VTTVEPFVPALASTPPDDDDGLELAPVLLNHESVAAFANVPPGDK
jgi:hypothetical protein